MTVEGAEKLREELLRLRSVERPRIIRAIAEAREHGDLRENAGERAAKEEQGFTEGRILEIEGKLANAQIIDVGKITPTGKVIFGSTVHLIDANDARVSYRIVGEDESNIKNGTLSVNSPIARALVGKSAGDTVEVRAPGGVVGYEIEKVEHLA